MANLMNRLTARAVATIDTAGLHADGGGLYLSTTGGGRRWVFVYSKDGKRREMGFGSARAGGVTLAAAREAARNARGVLAAGGDPIANRLALRAAESEGVTAATPSPVATFGAFAKEYIASVEDGWRNPIHRQQWRNSLEQHAACIWETPIDQVGTDSVLAVLQPIWRTKPETASRVRGRIEKILSAAKARGLRSQDAANPAQWRGHMDVLLGKRQRLTRGHHAAMDYADVPAFMARLASRDAMSAYALRFLILNASRSGEVLGARWGEVEGGIWTVPADRMKAGALHTIPLSPAALEILEHVGSGQPDEFIFKGSKPKQPLSAMAFAMLLRRMSSADVTTHGFRSSFKDWCANETEFPDELSEEALAHTIGSAVRRAYRRSAALERRKALMIAWSNYVSITTPVNQ